MTLFLLLCAAAGFFAACGGGGGGGHPQPVTLETIAVSAASASVMVGETDQLTAMGTYSDGSTQNLTGVSATTWTSSNVKVATISSSGLITGVAAGTATFTATAESVAGTSPMVTVIQPATVTSVTVSCDSASLAADATTQCAATVAGTGDFDPTVSWTSSDTTAVKLEPVGKDTVNVTGLTVANTAQVTITATSKQDATKSSSAEIAVTRTITIGFAQPAQFPGNEVYSEYGFILGWTLACSGCQAGDALHTVGTVGQESILATLTQPTTEIPLLTSLDANFNVPGPLKFWFVGSDGVRSNTLWLLYRGSQNVAVQSRGGEVYYYYTGNGAPNAQGGFASVLAFKSDGTPDGSIPGMPMENSIAIDDINHYLVLAGEAIPGKAGLIFYDLNNLNEVNGVPIAVGYAVFSDESTQIFAVATNGGNSCSVAPEAGAFFCVKDSPDTEQPQPPIITITGLNEPLALAMPDASHVVIYCTGDQTLRWFTLDVVAGTATPSGTLALQEFAPVTGDFWNAYIAAGGWFIVQVGSTLGVMGQVVNADGTLSQEIALVDNASQTQIGANYKLPDGTILITPDPANNAIAIEYPKLPDISSDAPVTNFARLRIDTGTMVDLADVSAISPPVAFLVLNSDLLTGVLGQVALTPNQ